MVDWGVLCRPPCYVAAVHNLKPVAKCLAHAFSFLRNSGMPVQHTVCVGHSLGAHICGLMANYLDFRIERIIGKSNHLLLLIVFSFILFIFLSFYRFFSSYRLVFVQYLISIFIECTKWKSRVLCKKKK